MQSIMAEEEEDCLAVSTSNKTDLSSSQADIDAISAFTKTKTGSKVGQEVGDPNRRFTE